MADKIKGFKGILKLLPYAKKTAKKVVSKVDDVIRPAKKAERSVVRAAKDVIRTAGKQERKVVSASKKLNKDLDYLAKTGSSVKKPGAVRRTGQYVRKRPKRALAVGAGGLTVGFGLPYLRGKDDTVDTSFAGISGDTTYNPYAATDEQTQLLDDALSQMAAGNAAPSTGTSGTGGTGAGSAGTGYIPAAYPGVGDQSGNITYVDNYGNLRSAFNQYAGNLQGYGSAKGAGIRGTYDQLSDESLADAAKAEAIARASYGDVQKIGTDYSAAALADVSGVGAAGPNELTGMTPVGGDSYDISAGVATDANIAADYVLRDLNLTRDDLQYMSGMAKQMGPAYEAQLNENITMLIANKQFELEQSIAGQQAEDRRSAAEMNQQRLLANESYRQQWLANQEQYRQQAASDLAANDRQVARDQEQYRQEAEAARIKRVSDTAAFELDTRMAIALAAQGVRAPDPTVMASYAQEWANILKDKKDAALYKQLGYDTDNPSSTNGWSLFVYNKLNSAPTAG